MLKVAVIGVGHMGKNHIRVLMDIPEVEVVGVVDANLEEAKAFVQKYKLATYADVNALFDEQQPHAIVIAVPTIYHRAVALTAIERQIHVLVEKPIASTLAEANEIICAAKQHNVTLAVGHIERFNPAVIELKRRIDAGELGKIFMIHARRQSPFPRRIQDVGVASDLATHELDMMRYLTGSEVVDVKAEVSHVISNPPREDIVFGLLRFESGILGILDVNWITPTTIRELSITGERGMFVVNYLTQELSFHENPAAPNSIHGTTWDFSVAAGHTTRFQIPRREPLRSELEAFVQAILLKQKPVVDGNDGLQALELALKLRSYLRATE